MYMIKVISIVQYLKSKMNSVIFFPIYLNKSTTSKSLQYKFQLVCLRLSCGAHL